MSIELDLKNWGFSAEHSKWLVDFRRANGRAPRVLSIGNIANNAYKNAVILRQCGVECDVLCPNYYHVMGVPEWEEGRFSTSELNFDRPDWSSVPVAGFERPKWFAQGYLGTCLDYLISLREGAPSADALWDQLLEETNSPGFGSGSAIFHDPHPPEVVEKAAQRLQGLFKVCFPARSDAPQFEAVSLSYYGILADERRWKRLFSHYDVVTGYAIDGIYPLFFGKRPYICFEHGTIRSIPFDENILGQLCALSYVMADDVLITNCDNVVAANRLNLNSYRFVPHAILERKLDEQRISQLRADLLARHQADFIVFHPPRQHWSSERNLNFEKGNDIFLRGFADFVKTARPKAVAGLVNWGQHVAETKRLIEELGIEDRVFWIDPVPVQVMTDYVAASDVLADQFVIGAWGSIMPIGMMLGKPTLLYLNEEVHHWCFPVMPPVLNAKTVDEVSSSLTKATDDEYRHRIAADGVRWYNQYHSENVVAGRLFDSLIAAKRSERECEMKRSVQELRAQLSILEFERPVPKAPEPLPSEPIAPPCPAPPPRRVLASILRYVPGIRSVSRLLLRYAPNLRGAIVRRLQLD
ncbi:glycosyltransferase [Bradyrhizobium mercantei]|uniref:glycosyltransferase n=1 Tax=Bradyrhizobium mercantei TaxID=1904807 RepID=UPI001177C91C|nr:glycosyltransferase [Bradyrhizobium mercantei]